MIERTAAYQRAIVGDTRRTVVRVIVDISDPDLTFEPVRYSGIAPVCVPEQVHDKEFELVPFGTLETDRWVLDGSMQIFPDTPEEQKEQAGWIGDVLSQTPMSETGLVGAATIGRARAGETGSDYEAPVWVEVPFANVSILQACSVWFPTAEYDGVADTFTVEIEQGGTVYFTKQFSHNRDPILYLRGFTVMNPDLIRLTVTKWSRDDRRLRVVEIVPGIYERWEGGEIESLSVKHQGDISCLSLPYGTCKIKMDNSDRRFEPRNKDGFFKSLEARQNIDVQLGVRLEDGSDEYKRVGRFYQYSGGWKTGDNNITMQWDLVDMIGLLAEREFIPPDTLPNTLEGWIAALSAQLGTNFADMYTVDAEYAGIALTVRSPGDIAGARCGDLLRYACMATGTWPRADAATGKLAVEPLWDQGSKITLDNLNSYPVMKANSDLAAIIFTLNDGNQTQYVVSGNTTASSETKSVQNPFIKTKDQALTAAKLILSAYGGNRLEIVGRGDMASEIGDVDTVWLDEGNATTARRIQQDLSLSEGVLKDCASVLLQADGTFLYSGRAVITKSGTWKAPAEAGTTLRLILSGGGSGGRNGESGDWDGPGADGADGEGGLIWAGTIQINPEQEFSVKIGTGGSAGEAGTETTFGVYSSANGVRYPYGYTDIASGSSYARAGVSAPQSGTGDGGRGGKGGIKGNKHKEEYTFENGAGIREVIDNYPGGGTPGTPGASGCAVVYWDKGD